VIVSGSAPVLRWKFRGGGGNVEVDHGGEGDKRDMHEDGGQGCLVPRQRVGGEGNDGGQVSPLILPYIQVKFIRFVL
jgi:hypothetical protein